MSFNFRSYGLNVIPAKVLRQAQDRELVERQESSLFMLLWILAFAGMTRFLTFYDSIKNLFNTKRESFQIE